MQAAEVPSIHYTIKEGLPSNTVYDIYQDKEGHMWFATDKGIGVYNGLHFRNFTTDDGLSDNEGLEFKADYYGRLWICTYNGSLMYYQDGIFHTAANTPFLKLPHKGGMTNVIHPQKDSSVCFYFDNRSFFLNLDRNHFRYYDLRSLNRQFLSFALRYIEKIAADRYDLYYFNLGLKVTIDTNVRVLSVQKIPANKLFWLTVVPGSHIASGGRESYLLDSNCFHNTNENNSHPFPPVLNRQQAIQRIYTEAGLNILCTSYGLIVNNRILFPGLNITSFLKDREGNYWISTHNNGVYKISASFLLSGNIPDAYTTSVMYAGREGSQSVLLGTRKRNMYRLNQDSCILLYQSNTADSNKKYGTGHLFDGTHYLNFGGGSSTNEQFMAFKAAGKHFNKTSILININDKAINVNNLFLNPPYIYLLNNRRSLHYFRYKDLEAKKGRQVIPVGNIYPSGSTLIYHCASDNKSNLWFSTIDAMYRVKDTVAKKQLQFGNLGLKEFTVNGDYLVGCTFDNRLIVCRTYADNHIDIDSSAPNPCIWDRFYTINDSIILITTNKLNRLLILKPSAGQPAFSIRIPEDPFIPQMPEYVYACNERCYFFKDQAATWLPVTDLLKTPMPPVLAFSQLKIADSTAIHIDSAVHLTFRQAQGISIGFTTLSFNSSELEYEYNISDQDNPGKWIRSGEETINLYQLGSGDYRIQIRARTPGGTYSTVKTFLLIVAPPFWLSWWFLLLCVTCLGAISWFLVRFYIRKAIRSKEKEMKFLKSEYKALNALMNPHFIFNTLNSVQSLINKDDKQASSEHIRTVADLIRQNMHNVARDQITLEEELTLVINYLKLEQLRFSWLHFELHIDDAIDTDDIMVPPLILQPLVENAILHGLWPAKLQQGIINIQVIKKEKRIVINITDNGKGFSNNANKDRNPNHQSTAVNNISSRMQQLSAMHGKSYTFHIQELKNGEMITGVTATIEIEA